VELRIEPVDQDQFETLLPMIADYQRFYGVREVDDARNREFFRRFIAPSDDGMLIAAWSGPDPVGYACLYWHFTSVGATETVLMNDLYVAEAVRGAGAGRALIDACADVARQRGVRRLEWATRPDNDTARRLYDSTGATASTWVSYELDVGA
jgi:GNAT superfamily N-acetyltransferase